MDNKYHYPPNSESAYPHPQPTQQGPVGFQSQPSYPAPQLAHPQNITSYPPQPYHSEVYPPTQQVPMAATSAQYGFSPTYDNRTQRLKPFDVEGQGVGAETFDFSDKSIRLGFVRKVYSILTCQLLVTLAMVCLVTFVSSMREWVKDNIKEVLIASVVSLVLVICISCFQSIRRTYPMNFIFLGLFTLTEGFTIAAITVYYTPESVLMAVGITTVVCLGLTIFALQTKWDFTVCGGILFVAGLIFMIFGFLMVFSRSNKAHIAFNCIGVFLFSIYLIYDTQMMLGGNHKHSISPEEYVFAALSLYLDIVLIFIYILALFGQK